MEYCNKHPKLPKDSRPAVIGELKKRRMNMKAEEILEEIKEFVQECREEGETDLRTIIGYIERKIREIKKENE